MKGKGDGSKAKPWQLKTPPGSSEFTAYRDDDAGELVVQVGSTQLKDQLRAKTNPVKGWYGLKKLAVVEHGARNNRMRAAKH